MKIEVKIMEPNDYDWTKAKQSGLCAIVSKPSYHREMGVGNGPLSAIMLGEKNDTTLAAATMMCVRPDIVSIIDPLNPISKCSEARFPHTSESVNDMISRYTDSGNTLFKNESDIKIVLSLVEPLIKYERSEISENELHNLLIERTPNFEEFFEATGKDEQDWENFLSDYSFQRNARKIITEQSLKNPSANTEQILEIIESELREIAKNEKGPVNSHENSPSKFEDAFVRNFADLSTRDFEIFTHQLSQTFKGDISDYINFIADYAKSEYANPEHLDLMGKNDNYSIVRVEVACNITTPVKTLNWMIQNDENPDVIEFAKETLEQI